MKFTAYLPCQKLCPYINQFIIAEHCNAQTYKILPGTALVMGFQYCGKLAYLQGETKVPLTSAGVTGLLNSYRLFENTANTGTLLVVFKETGAAHFIKAPLNELFNQSLSLEHFFDRDKLAEVEQTLSAAGGDKQRIQIIEDLLINHLDHKPQDQLVIAAIEKINRDKGNMRIEELARHLNTSLSPLEKRFRRVVGASPKRYASLIRLKHTILNLQTDNYQEIIYRVGYYDQAHFIKDFKTFTGNTPEQFAKEREQIK